MTSYTLHEERVAALMEAWGKEAQAGTVPPAMCVIIGKAFEDMQGNQRSIAVAHHLFDTDEISEVAIALSCEKRKLIVATCRSATEFALPESISSATNAELSDASSEPQIAVKFICEAATDAANSMMDELRACGSVAVAQRELPEQRGQFAEALVSSLKGATDITVLDRPGQIGALLAVKDRRGIECVQKAAALASATLKKYVLPQMESQLESDRRLPMNTFSESIWEMLQHPNRLPGLEQLPSQHYDGAFQPVVVQSGGNYSLRIIQDSMRPEPLIGDCVIFGYGAVHMGYTAYIARTVLIEACAPRELSEYYSFVLSISNKVIECLRPGTPLNEVHSKAMSHAMSLNSTLAAKLTRDFGFMTGLLVLEARGMISEKATTVVQAGMAFAVRIGLDGLECKGPDAETHTYAILLADTVVVRESSTDLFTKGKRELNDILYKEETVEEEEPKNDAPRDLRMITRTGKGAIPQISSEDARRARQQEILAEKAASWTAAGGQIEVADTEDLRLTELGRLAKGDTVSCRPGDSDAPKLGPTQFDVERQKETIWIPIGKRQTPFHISTVSKIDIKSLSSAKHLMTISFHHMQESNAAFRVNRTKSFLKQVTLVGSSKDKFETFANQVHDIQQNVKNKDQIRKQQQGVVKQGGLLLNKKGTAPRLKRVKCRPPPLQAKFGVAGDLEAHDNGFRFVFIGGEPLVLLYDNVKQLIFQPSENDICTVFHISLKQPVMVGKKKCEEVQFVAEVAETSEAVAISRRTYEEELAADAKDLQRVKQTNAEYVMFSQKVEGIADRKVQMPLKEFVFTGCSSRAMTKFRGNSECLWSVSEMPFFTLALSDIEVASLERILPGGSNFDIAFIHRGCRKVSSVTTIPQSRVEMIKDWLNIARIIYFESTANISWGPVLKEIRETKGWEPWGPDGWRTYWESDAEDEESEEGEDSDTTYEGSSSDDDDESEEDDSEWAEEVSDSDFSTPSTSEESAESWDEMERKAEEHDRRRAREEQISDADAPGRKVPRKEPPPAPHGGRPKAPPQMLPPRRPR